MQESWVRFLGWEDPLDEGNGNPLQYSCLENPMDRGAWWAILHGVAKSQTWLSDFTFFLLVKVMVFPVDMCGCESWTVKKAERRRIDDFELWCWRRLLGVPWTARRSNQSILKEISLNSHWKDWCWNSNILATWCEELDHFKRPWCWERLRAGGDGATKGWDGWMASLTQWTWVWGNSGSWQWRGRPGVLQSMGSQSVQTWLRDCTELNCICELKLIH